MIQYTFPKSARLLTRSDFVALSSKAFCFKGKKVVIYWKKTALQSPRVGISVTKKYADAHRRNRLKRFVREAFRLLRHTFPYSIDCHVRPREASETQVAFSEILDDFQQFIETLRL